MGRRVKVEVSALNIRLHPHDEGRYQALIDRLFGLKKIVRVHGDRSALMTQLSRSRETNNYVMGTITTFTNIDFDAPWFNALTMAEATNTELQRVSVPENLYPNVSSFYFRFDYDNHILLFEKYGNGRTLTHSFALKYVQGLVEDPSIVAEFGDVKVTLVQSPGGKERLFDIPRITKLTVYIERPNADLWPDDFEELAEEHLGEKNARSMTITYEAERGGGIQRDPDIDRLVDASLANGRAEASGYGENGHQTASTRQFPKTVQDKFDPEVLTESQMFEDLANRFRRERG